MAHVLQDQRCLTVGTLVEAFRAAKEEFSQGTASWKAAASGPIKLAIWAATQLGWDLPTATTLHTAEGLYVLTDLAPKQLERLYWETRGRIEVARSVWSALAAYDQGEAQDSLRPGQAIWTTPLRRAYAKMSHPLVRACAVQAFAGTPHADRNEGNCRWCPASPDSVHHRAYYCEATREHWQRLPAEILVEARRQPGDLYSRRGGARSHQPSTGQVTRSLSTPRATS